MKYIIDGGFFIDWTRTQNDLVCKRILDHLAKWLSVRLQTKWFWVRVQLQSLKLQISRLQEDFALESKEFHDIQATIESGFTLKRVHDMTRTCSQGGGVLYLINDTYYYCSIPMRE